MDKNLKFTDRELLNPRSDRVFKKLFEEDDILIHFLNSVLGQTKFKKIKNRESPETIISTFTKAVYYDIVLEEENGDHIIIEMQRHRFSEFYNRLQYYTSSKLINQLESGDDYGALTRVIIIVIVDFNIDQVDNLLYCPNNPDSNIKLINYNFLVLPNMDKDKNANDNLKEWAKLLSAKPGLQGLKFVNDLDPIYKKAYNRISVNTFTKEEIKTIQREEKEKSIFLEQLKEAENEKKQMLVERQKMIDEKQVMLAEKQEMLDEKKEMLDEKKEMFEFLVKSTKSYDEYNKIYGVNTPFYLSKSNYNKIKKELK